MTASLAEREIRDALVAHLRLHLPSARIIHEMNTSQGGKRIDVAAVTPSTIFAFEIKSERDTLKRLARQIEAFTRCSHASVAVLHQKWFDHTPLPDGRPRMRFDLPVRLFGRYTNIWAYPKPETGTAGEWYRWRNPQDLVHRRDPVPASDPLLHMLWHAELKDEMERHRIYLGRRPSRLDMIHAMALDMTGREVAAAVCRQLRGRRFAEADPPLDLAA